MSEKMVRIISGEHMGKCGTLESILWCSNFAIIRAEDGKVLVTRPIDIVEIEQTLM